MISLRNLYFIHFLLSLEAESFCLFSNCGLGSSKTQTVLLLCFTFHCCLHDSVNFWNTELGDAIIREQIYESDRCVLFKTMVITRSSQEEDMDCKRG